MFVQEDRVFVFLDFVFPYMLATENKTPSNDSAGLGAHESASATKEDMVLPLAAEGTTSSDGRLPSQEIVLPKEPLFLPVSDHSKDDAAAALVHQVFSFTHTHTCISKCACALVFLSPLRVFCHIAPHPPASFLLPIVLDFVLF